MTVTDVNAEFDTERQGQIERVTAWNESLPAQRAAAAASMASRVEAFNTRAAAGELRDLGNGRYEATTGWDRGEIFTVSRNTRTQLVEMVMPESGLDTSTGQAAFYGREPEWHQLGTIIPAGLSDISAILKASGCGFTVKQRPVEFSLPGRDDVTVHTEVPGQFVNYRDDTGAPLGVVGKIYTPVQPAQSVGFLQALVNDGNAVVDTMGALDGGKRIFCSLRLPEDMVIDAGGVNDHIRLYVVVFDRFDGQGQFQAVATPWRPRCGNTERLGLANAVTSWGVRHTTTAPERVTEAQKTLALSHRYAGEFAAEENELARAKMSLDTVDELIAEIWGEQDATAGNRAKLANSRRRDEIHGLARNYTEELGRTGYALERVFTDWFDHVAPKKVIGDGAKAAARATAALVGTDDGKKTKVHAKLLQVARG
jgi:phage/plasmid-like protein (TIGR03299 family)